MIGIYLIHIFIFYVCANEWGDQRYHHLAYNSQDYFGLFWFNIIVGLVILLDNIRTFYNDKNPIKKTNVYKWIGIFFGIFSIVHDR